MTNHDPHSQWKAIDTFHLSAFSFGSTAVSTPLGVVILPVLVLGMVPDELKNTYLGLIGLVALAVAMIVQPVAGHISDRTLPIWGRRTPYIAVGSLLTCVAVFAIGGASTYLVLVLAMIAYQVCINTALGPYQALIRDLAPRARRGVVSSFKVLADSSGGAGFLVLVAFLLGSDAGSQRDVWLWVTLGVLSLTLGASAAWTVMGIRGRETRSGQLAGPLNPRRIHTRAHAQFGWFLGSRFCSFAALAVLQTYALFFLGDVVGLANPVRAVGTMTIVTGGSLLLAVYPFGRLSDRIGRKWVIVGTGVVGAGGVFTLLLTTSFIQVILVSSVLGASAGAFLSVSWAMATDLVSTGRTAQQMGFTNTAAAGGAVLAKLAGPGIDLLNQVEAGLGYSALLTACGLLFLLGALLLVPLPAGPALSTAAPSRS